MSDLARLRRAATVAVVASAIVPAAVVEGGPVLCPFRAATGLPCPTCGMTRSWNAMGHGRLRDASAFHLMGPVTFVGALVLVAAGDQRAARLVEQRAWSRPVVGALGAAWIVAWLWRLAGARRG